MPLIPEKKIEKLLKDIYEGRISVNALPTDLYLATVEVLADGVLEGMGIAFDDAGVRFPVLRQNLLENVAIFSGAKTYQQARFMGAAIFTPEGEVVPFADWKVIARGIFDEFNEAWLETEYRTAIGVSQMAAEWKDIEEAAGDFPALRYVTVGDDAVRDEHAEMDGFVALVNDPVWEYMYPPNGWNCRCIVEQVDDVKEVSQDPPPGPDNVQETFRFNAGRTDQVFDGSHPYFQVAPGDEDAAKRNFDLPAL